MIRYHTHDIVRKVESQRGNLSCVSRVALVACRVLSA